MAEKFEQLNDSLIAFIQKQHVFFTGTARSTGSVNISPKGMESLRVTSPREIIWQNYTGSGNETAAHLLENNRMTLLFCSFEKKPLILRVYGTATAVHLQDPGWEACADQFPAKTGTRQFYILDIDLVQTSCGFAVPYMDFVSDRDALDKWADQRGKSGIRQYWEEKNQLSLDGYDTGIFNKHSK